MNRRELLKLLGMGAALAAAPSLVIPKRTIFLPPRGGWTQDVLRMREISCYEITNDAMLIRHDFAFRDPHGSEFQFGIDHLVGEGACDWEKIREISRAKILERVNSKCGLSHARPPRVLRLLLPEYAHIARFV